MEFLLIEIYSEQRRMGYILKDIKSSLISICPVVDEDLDDFLKNLDNEFSLNLRLPEFELEEEHIV
jgi:hypothetical protein